MFPTPGYPLIILGYSVDDCRNFIDQILLMVTSVSSRAERFSLGASMMLLLPRCILTNELVSLKYLAVCLVHTRRQSILIKYTHENCGISSENITEIRLKWYWGGGGAERREGCM